MASEKILRGPTAVTVSENVGRLMKARALTTATLSEELGKIGRPILPTGITKIVKGDRRVDVDDLMALAIALGVNPNALLLPNSARGTRGNRVTGSEYLPERSLWDWAEGKEPLLYEAEEEDEDGEAYMDFQMHARPRGRRTYLRGQSEAIDAARKQDIEEWNREWAETGPPAPPLPGDEAEQDEEQ